MFKTSSLYGAIVRDNEIPILAFSLAHIMVKFVVLSSFQRSLGSFWVSPSYFEGWVGGI